MGCNCGGSEKIVRQPLGRNRPVEPSPPDPNQIGPLSADHYANPGEYAWQGPLTNDEAK